MTAPKTILILDYNNVPQMLSGHSLVTLLRHLNPSRHRAAVVFNRAGQYSTAASETSAETIILPYGGGNIAKRTWQYGRLILSLWRLARRVKPSLIYANNVMAARPAILLKALTGIPVVVHIRNIGFFSRTAPLALRADRFMVVSRATGEGTLPPKQQSRATVVYDGIELSHYPVADRRSRIEARAKLGIPADALVVGMAGRLTPQKGQEFFVEMAKRICAARKDVFFVLAGAIPSSQSHDTYEQAMAEASANLIEIDRLKWLPYVDDMASFWSSLDVAVVPSAGPEAFSRAVIEAMACGVPVVATRSGGPEEILENSKTGFLVPMRDADALVEAVTALLNDAALREKISYAARRTVEERFSAERYAAKVAEVFDRVAVSYAGSAHSREFTGRYQ